MATLKWLLENTPKKDIQIQHINEYYSGYIVTIKNKQCVNGFYSERGDLSLVLSKFNIQEDFWGGIGLVCEWNEIPKTKIEAISNFITDSFDKIPSFQIKDIKFEPDLEFLVTFGGIFPNEIDYESNFITDFSFSWISPNFNCSSLYSYDIQKYANLIFSIKPNIDSVKIQCNGIDYKFTDGEFVADNNYMTILYPPTAENKSIQIKSFSKNNINSNNNLQMANNNIAENNMNEQTTSQNANQNKQLQYTYDSKNVNQQNIDTTKTNTYTQTHNSDVNSNESASFVENHITEIAIGSVCLILVIILAIKFPKFRKVLFFTLRILGGMLILAIFALLGRKREAVYSGGRGSHGGSPYAIDMVQIEKGEIVVYFKSGSSRKYFYSHNRRRIIGWSNDKFAFVEYFGNGQAVFNIIHVSNGNLYRNESGGYNAINEAEKDREIMRKYINK